MTVRPFTQVDVFTTRVGYGNALAVVLDANGLDVATMQRFATWTNLSETTFVLTPTRTEADFRLRIFTPRQELAFAGHPTVGTTHAMLEAGRIAPDKKQLLLECGAGLLPVRIDDERGERRIFVQAPRPKWVSIDEETLASLAQALGAAPADRSRPCIADVGAVWLIADLGEAWKVRSLRPEFARLSTLSLACGVVGVAVFGREMSAEAAIAVRAFCPADGIPEDPVTGSANAAIGAYLHANGGLAKIGTRYRASQGREVGRDGYIDVEIDPHTGMVKIGGACVTCVAGSCRIGDGH